MKHLLHTLLVAATLVAAAPATAQEAVNIQTAYGTGDVQKSLAELGYTVATAQAKFPAYWAKWKAWGRADADFLKNTFLTCAHEDVSWGRGSANIYWGANGGYPGGNGVPLKFNQQLRWPFGAVTGSGLFIASLSDTRVMPDHDRWNGDPKKRNVLVSWSYGVDGLYGYHEGAYLNGVRFWGDRRSAYWDPTYESSGVVLFDAGEGSQIGRIKSDYFNTYGLHIERGTPCDVENVSVFLNGKAGVGLVGTAMSTIHIGMLTGDDNLRLIEMVPGGGREAGGNVDIDVIKNESATTSEAEWRASGYNFQRYTGHPIVLRGLFNFNIDAMSYASSHVKSAQLFWVDARLQNGTPVNSMLKCSGIGFGFGALLVDSRLGTWYAAPAEYSAWSMTYTTMDGVMTINGKVVPPSGTFPVGMGPMSYVLPGGTLNYATGQPQQQETGTPPVPPPTCTYTYSAWSAWGTCTNGQQVRTRTVATSTPAGCAGTPVLSETQACSTTPPPTGATLATLASNPVTGACAKVTVNWVDATRVEITGLKAVTLSGSRFICSGPTGARIVVDGAGALWYGDMKVYPDGTLKANTAYAGTLVFTFPATTLDRLGDSNRGTGSNCNAFTGTWTNLVVKK